MLYYFNVLLLIVSCFVLSVGCSLLESPDQIFSGDEYLKLDGTVCNKKTKVCYKGIGVFSSASTFEGQYKAHGKIDYFHVGSCHRSHSHNDLTVFDRSHSKKHADFKLNNLQRLEGRPGCGFKFFAAELDKGRHSFAYMLFDSPKLKLKASTDCDGRFWRWGGTSACQSRAGNVARIYLPRPVRFSQKGFEACPTPKKVGINTYEFEIGLGYCAFTFKATDKDLYHTLVTYGHDQEFVRVIKNKSFWFFGGD